MKLIIRNLYAVGMHHWGDRSLAVGERYSLEREHDNPRDVNAVCISDKKKSKRAYLKREHAYVIARLMRMCISDLWLLKPKQEPEVRDKRFGPQQRCNVGCLIKDSDKTKAATEFLHIMGMDFEVK